MDKPAFSDYVQLLHRLFDQFEQQQSMPSGRGHPFVYKHKELIVFFIIMQFKRIFQFKTQRRWLVTHPDQQKDIGFKQVPDRATLSRRYKALYSIIQGFVAFLGQYTEDLGEAFNNDNLYEDKSLFKAQGPVWHQSDRQANHIPENLHHLDTDATWSKSAYHGWVYGYGLHLSCNQTGVPKLTQVETAVVSESQVLNEKESQIIHNLAPSTLTGDNSYSQAIRIRRWAKQNIALITPAIKWIKGRYAKAYHRFLEEPENADLLRNRRTAIEPVFDLVAKVVGATGNQKQLSIQNLANVRTCLALATLTVLIAMIANNIWELPLHDISHMMAVFT